MPKFAAGRVPKYRKHKATGQAVVTIAGHDHYLGPWKSKASLVEYDRLIGEWIVAGRPSRPTGGHTVEDLVTLYYRWASATYVKNGEPTAYVFNLEPILRLLCQKYGHVPAVEFGPLAVKALIATMVSADQCRSYINMNLGRLRRLFKWGVSEQLLPPHVYEAIKTVEGPRKGRTEARESQPVTPVEDTVVNQTLPFLTPMVADMVRLQRLTGCRPDEICSLRPCDIDDAGDVWAYRPSRHKTEHHGRERVIFIGPQAQTILRPYVLREKNNFCFVPAESERTRNANRRAERQSKMTPSQAARRPKRNRCRPPGERYDHNSYRRAIHRACDMAFPAPAPLDQLEKETKKAWMARLTEEERVLLKQWQRSHRWSPNQLRHAAATEIRKRFGIEAAQVALGHAKADVTQLYAERDLQKAESIMRQVG
jgi:integrase